MHKLTPILCFLLLLICGNIASAQQTPADYANPFIGTGGHGHTFPGATVPFGMMQLSPDTRLEGWDGCGGYHYSDEYIYGFSHTHLSGTGVPDYCDVLLMPFTGEDIFNNGYDGKPGYRSKFSHTAETAEAGYYQVKLPDNNITVQLTATVRAGMHQYQFQEGAGQKVIIDLQHRDLVMNSWLRQTGENELEGYRESRAWANDQRVYFVIKVSQNIKEIKLALNDKTESGANFAQGKNVKGILNFGKASDKPLIIKVGISAVSIENARQNLDAEINHWDFSKVRRQAKEAWNKELSKITVSSTNTDQLTIFYTALYHTMIAPNTFSDVNGEYLGRDLQRHTADHPYYTVFSLWDTYRALHPLFTIIDQKRTNDFVQTFIKQYEDGGLLPVWELSANETFCMIGYHAVPVIADAFMKGIRDYDHNKALQAMVASASQDHFGLRFYKKYGYIPANHDHESVSKTLEYAYDDWCIAQMARQLNRNDIADPFFSRAQSYKQLFDPSTGFMRARHNGAWFEPFDAREVNFNYTEANSWQYSFYVPHDMQYFTQLHNGKKGLESKLDDLFTAPSATTGREQSDITGLIGQYAHGNEPSHHIAYLYNYAGAPWKTQEKVNYIMQNFYTNAPDGLIGNEDCGQMSAWAVFSALGFYPVCPGTDQYIIGKPQFEDMTIRLENGNTFRINAQKLSKENMYIQSASLNGKPLKRSYITHDEIMKGGTLTFKLSDKPNKKWGAGTVNEPFTSIDAQHVAIAPVVEKMAQLFDTSTLVTISAINGETIRYTTDGSEPDENSSIYSAPIKLNQSTVIKFKGFKDGCIPSGTVESVYTRKPDNLVLTLLSKYEPQYTGNGPETLIDGLKGSEDFRLGGWQGYMGTDVEAIIQLTGNKPVTSVSIGCMQDINAWIFMPTAIELYSSADGKNFSLISTLTNDVPLDKWGTILKDYTFNVNNVTDRFFKVKVVSINNCPDDHKGAGNPAWLFLDEISVK